MLIHHSQDSNSRPRDPQTKFLPQDHEATVSSSDIPFTAGDLVSTAIPGGDEGIAAEVKRLFAVFTEGDIRQAISN